MKLRSGLFSRPRPGASVHVLIDQRSYQRANLNSRRSRYAPLCLSLAALFVGLSGCMSGAERRQANLEEDARTCASFGSNYGSPAYAECMLAQQRRRDVEQRESLEKTRMTSEIARDAQIMTDRARKQRCERDPNRSECGTRDR
jgi:hypothetical protein